MKIYKQFTIEKVSEEKLVDVAYLFRASFNSNTSVEAIKRKHVECDGDYKYIAFIAYHTESMEPAAYYAVYPQFMNRASETILTAQSGDTMTNPKYQKKGLFVELAKNTFEYCQEVGIDVVTGFPNQNSYHGFIKHLEFKELEPLSEMMFLENRFEFYRFFGRNKLLSGLHFGFIKLLVSLLFRKGNIFQNSNHHNTGLCYVNHSNQFFKSKSHYNKVLIKVNRTNVWLKLYYSLNRIEIGDIEVNSNTNLKKVIRTLNLFTRLSGLRFLHFQSCKNGFLYSKLKQYSRFENDASKFIIRDFRRSLDLDNVSLLLADSDGF